MASDPKEQTVKSSDGTELKVYKWASSSPAKAQLLVVHGYLEHGMRYSEFASALAQGHSIGVTVFDVRGHGKSSGVRAFVPKWEDYFADLEAVMETLTDKTPKFVLGHSNGGLICLDYFHTKGEKVKDKFKGLLISSPFLAPADKLPYIKVLVSKLLGNIFPKLAVPVNENEISGKTLTRDPEKIKDHDEDELNMSKITVGWAYQCMLAQTRITKQCKSLPVPLMFAYAEKDRVANPTVNKKFAQMVMVEDKTVLERKDCCHEILNEIDRKELYGLLADWILKRA